MDHYIIGKKDLDNLLHILGLLKPGEKLTYVDNLSLIDQSRDQVGLGVCSSEEAVPLGSDHALLTDQQLKYLFIRIASLELMLHQQKGMLKKEMEKVLDEMEKRSLSHPATEDTLPPEIQIQLDEEISRILSGDSDRDED